MVYPLIHRLIVSQIVLFNDLIQRCANGDREAYDTFVERYYSLFFGVVQKRLQNRDTSEDIVQEIILKVIQKNLFAKFRGNSEPEFEHYLVRIA